MGASVPWVWSSTVMITLVPASPRSWALICERLRVFTSVSPIFVMNMFLPRAASEAGLPGYTRTMRA